MMRIKNSRFAGWPTRGHDANLGLTFEYVLRVSEQDGQREAHAEEVRKKG